MLLFQLKIIRYERARRRNHCSSSQRGQAKIIPRINCEIDRNFHFAVPANGGTSFPGVQASYCRYDDTCGDLTEARIEICRHLRNARNARRNPVGSRGRSSRSEKTDGPIASSRLRGWFEKFVLKYPANRSLSRPIVDTKILRTRSSRDAH